MRVEGGNIVALKCNLHGKHVHLLHNKTKKEYAFITPNFEVFPDDCIKCSDPECPYNFNIKKLLKNKKLRKKVLDYVFDASFDDMLLEQGLIAERAIPMIYELQDDAKIYSKTCYPEKSAKRLLRYDETAQTRRKAYFDSIDDYSLILQSLIPAPKRIIIKRKDVEDK